MKDSAHSGRFYVNCRLYWIHGGYQDIYVKLNFQTLKFLNKAGRRTCEGEGLGREIKVL